MKPLIATGAAVGLITAGLCAMSTTTAPQAHAQPYGGAIVFGSGGSQCDGPFYPDGSFQRCASVYVGIGGWNCFIVPPP